MVKNKAITTRTADELGEALGLSLADSIEMEFRSEFTVALVRILQKGQLTHAQVAKKSGTSRTRVTAIANGNTKGISTDVLIRVLDGQTLKIAYFWMKLQLSESTKRDLSFCGRKIRLMGRMLILRSCVLKSAM